MEIMDDQNHQNHQNLPTDSIKIDVSMLRGYSVSSAMTPVQLYTQIRDETDEKIPYQKWIWADIQKMMLSMSAHTPNHRGLINPIIVGPAIDEKYDLISGRIRLLAWAGLAIENPHNQQYRYIKAIIQPTYQPSTRMIENRPKNQTAMEIAWGLISVWEELDREGPPASITDAYAIPYNKKRGRPKGSGLTWPTWDAVAERVGYSNAKVSNHARLTKLKPETQIIINNYMFSEAALRYMVTQMPPPDFNDEIDEIIALATCGERVWGRTEIDREVDRRMGIQKTMSPEQIRTQLVAIDRAIENMWPRPDEAALEEWLSQYAGTNQVTTCRDIIEQMEKMSQKMSRMAKIYRDIEESS